MDLYFMTIITHNDNCLSCKSSRIEPKQLISVVLNKDLKPFTCRQGVQRRTTTVRIRSYQEAVLPCKNYKSRR